MSMEPSGARTTAAAAAPKEIAVVGTSVGHYHVLARLGAGGMGVVYEAEDLRLQRHVALKFLPQSLARDRASLSRFEREARLASSLNHPNICTIYDIGTADEAPFIVMELLDGETLRNRIASGPLTIDQFLAIAPQIVAAVSAAHARQIVHRDLKPANIFVTANGTTKVLDFGLAKLTSDAGAEETIVGPPSDDSAWQRDDQLVTTPGTILGTAAYMAPEQLRGRAADPRTDVFALGVIFYEALTGVRPFAGADIGELQQQILHRTPLPLPALNAAVPADIDRVVRRCLEKEPAARFASATDLQQELTATIEALTRRAVPAANEWRPRRIDSIAVLPFAVAGSDADSEYLGDGICEDLIREIAQVPGIRVKARSIVQRYRDRASQPSAVGNELGVAAIVLGTVSKRGNRLSLLVEFVRCDDESLLWSTRVTRDADELVAIEAEVLGQIVREISSRLDGAVTPATARGRTPSAEAHRLYLRGRACWNQRTPESLHRAIEHFSRAVEDDPEYGLAFAGLADAYSALGFYDLAPPADVMPRAKAAARRALQADPDLAEGHASMGLVSSIWDFDWDESGRRLRRALDLNPSLPYVHHWYAMQLSTLGSGDEAYAEIKQALVLDPLAPAAQADALNVLIRGRRFDECVHEARKALALDPRWSAGWAALGRALQYAGHTDEAIHSLEQAYALSPESVRIRALLASAYALAGQVDRAEQIRNGLTNGRQTGYVSSFWLAVIAHALGETDAALPLLGRAINERYPQVAYLAVDPIFDALRGRPEFDRLLAQIGVNRGTPAGASARTTRE